ncbi:pectate lyase [Hyphomonas sp.]|uniref:pectate lyase n=1 Tax=Hyphomonas sp. TaxID=87 RepID=UPI00391C6B8C
MKRDADYPRHAVDDVTAIADNLLIMQRDHGGWIENLDPLKVLSPEAEAAFIGEKKDARGSFDNRNVYPQIEYLAGAFALTGDARYKAGAEAGLRYLLNHQFENCGGWPHSVPAASAYQGRITVADEVFSGPLTLLRSIAEGIPPLDIIDADLRAASQAALARGEDCLLRLQVRKAGRLTGWAGQYDPETLAPVGGRSFELPAIVSEETVEILRYLMSIAEPSPEMIASIEAAAEWLRTSAIEGVRLETVPLEAEAEYTFHNTRSDRRLTPDPEAPPLWARFYDLEDNSVVLANRDGIRVERYDQVHPERRTGYSWYGNWPAKLLESEYPEWHCRVSGAREDGQPCG